MKGFVKMFLASFIGFTVLFSGVFIAAERFVFNDKSISSDESFEEQTSQASESTTIEEAIKGNKRLNILLVGTDGGRSDTMMIMSLGLTAKNIKLLSVPRDTYYHMKGYNAYDQRKLNAVYGHGEEKGGVKGVKTAVEEITKLKIPYYIEVNYDAVMEIVDLVGGVEFEVPFDMKYDDPTAKPPLHIKLKKGVQVLDGPKAIQFLRWRKNNGSSGTGDIDRTMRQQAFVTAAAKKAFGLKLPMVIKAAYENMTTNIALQDMLYLGTKMIGTDLSAIEKQTLPGTVDMKNGYSYLLPDEAAIKLLMETFDAIDVIGTKK